MQSVFAGNIEVSILRSGREIAKVIRPLVKPKKAGNPLQKKFWSVRDGVVDLDAGPISDEPGFDPPEDSDDEISSSVEDDDLQGDVITAPASDRLLVDAGPGTGKTYVACSRVAALINEGVPAGRIWLVSFTRTAVQEIRARWSRILRMLLTLQL